MKPCRGSQWRGTDWNPAARIVAAMPNTAGAGRFEKELSKATGTITSIQKHKCRAFEACDDGSWNEELFQKWRELGNPRCIPDNHYITVPGFSAATTSTPARNFSPTTCPPTCTESWRTSARAGVFYQTWR